MQFDKSGKSEHNKDWQKEIFISSVSFKYPTLKLNELKSLDVPSISSDDCLLFMWTSNPHLSQSIDLAKSGFSKINALRKMGVACPHK